jgi:hypothetical protein
VEFQQQIVPVELQRRRSASQVQLAVCGCAQHQVMFDIAAIVMHRLMYRAGQLFGMREYLLQGMPQQILSAHVEQVFSCRIQVGDTRLVVEHDDGGGDMFKRQE